MYYFTVVKRIPHTSFGERRGATHMSCRCCNVPTDVLETAVLDLSQHQTWTEVSVSWRATLAPVLACVTSCECSRDGDTTPAERFGDELRLLRWVAREQNSSVDAVRCCMLAGVSFAAVCGLGRMGGRELVRSFTPRSLAFSLRNSFRAVMDVAQAGAGPWQLARFAVHILVRWMQLERGWQRIMFSPLCLSSSGTPARKKARSKTSTQASLAVTMMYVSLEGIADSGVMGKQYGNIGKHKHGEKWAAFQMCVESAVQIVTCATYQDVMAITVVNESFLDIISWCIYTVSALFSTASFLNPLFVTAATFAVEALVGLSQPASPSQLIPSKQRKRVWDTCLEMFRACAVQRVRPPDNVFWIGKRLILTVQHLAPVGLLGDSIPSVKDVLAMMAFMHGCCCSGEFPLNTNDVTRFLHKVVQSSRFRDAWNPAFFRVFRFERLSCDWLWAMQAVLHGMYADRALCSRGDFAWSRRTSVAFLARATAPLFPAGTSLHTATAAAQCMAEVARQPWLCLCVVFAL